MASPGSYNMVVPQSTTYDFACTIQEGSTPWDLTGYTGIMTVRPFIGSTTATLVASTENGKMSLGTSNGRINVTFTALDTTIKAESYVYDIMLNSGGTITRILEGQFIVTAGVTV
jgi:hypothetical protein